MQKTNWQYLDKLKNNPLKFWKSYYKQLKKTKNSNKILLHAVKTTINLLQDHEDSFQQQLEYGKQQIAEQTRLSEIMDRN